jgi:HEAT repeat protein
MLALFRKRWFIALAVVGSCLFAAILAAQFFGAVSKFQGRTMEKWALQLGAPSPQAREQAASVIRAAGTNAVPELLKLLNKHDSVLRKRMWQMVNKLPQRLRDATFLNAQFPDALDIKCAAARGLGLLGPQAAAAVPALGQAMHSTTARLRLDAARALGQIGDAGLPELLNGLSDKDINVRYVAVHGLGEACSNTNLATLALLKITADSEPALSVVAGGSLRKLGTNIVPLLVHDLEQGDAENRLRAAKVVSALRLPRQMVLPSLLTMAHDENPRCRVEAVRALAGMPLPNPTMVDALIVALKDSEPDARISAASGLGQVRWQPKTAVTALTAALSDASPRVREAAARSLGLLGSPAANALSDLERLAEDADASVRAAAAEAAKKINAAKSRDAARQMTATQSP